MHQPHYLLISAKGKARQIPHLSIIAVTLILLLIISALITFTMYAFGKAELAEKEKAVVLEELTTRKAEIEVLLVKQTQFQTNLTQVEEELESIKENFQIYKMEVEGNEDIQ